MATSRTPRQCPFRPACWLVWLANYGLALSGTPMAFEPRGRLFGGPAIRRRSALLPPGP